nr:hypothetical protein [Tanacetum cinerariifolium]
MLALLTQSYKTFLPQTNNQLRTSSNTRNQATVQDDRVVVQNVQGRQNRGQGTIHEVEVQLDPVNDKAEQSYDSDSLSKVHDHDHYQDAVCEHHEEHAMHDNVQLNHVVDSHADYTSDSNMISYDQYVKDNAVPVVYSNVSSIPNDAYMMIYNDMYEPHAQSVSKTSRNTIVENSLTAKLATYKEQVELVSKDYVKPKVLAPGKYAIDVEPIVLHLRNNRETHLDYLRHLKESVETISDIVEEAKVVRPLDSSIISAYCYTKHSQELLEYAIGTCPQASHQRDKNMLLLL